MRILRVYIHAVGRIGMAPIVPIHAVGRIRTGRLVVRSACRQPSRFLVVARFVPTPRIEQMFYFVRPRSRRRARIRVSHNP